jgi:predicted nucleic acid-binding protein
MAGLVLDSSLATAWCFPDERSEYTNAVLRDVSRDLEALAPRLWAYEVRNSVLMGTRRQRITSADAQEFLVAISSIPIRLADPVSYDDVFDLANRHGLTVYDVAYLDFSLREGLPLASLDNALCNAARRCGVALFQV